jgi:hypothetical protein
MERYRKGRFRCRLIVLICLNLPYMSDRISTMEMHTAFQANTGNSEIGDGGSESFHRESQFIQSLHVGRLILQADEGRFCF